MLKVAAIVVVAYAAGHPALASVRPEVLEKPLAGFHGDVNNVSGSIWNSMVAADRTGLLRSISRAVGIGSLR